MTIANDARIHVIIPVKDMAAHIADCLPTITPQLLPGDRISVVDDGSVDDLASAIRDARVELLRVEKSRGPYAARHAVASASDSQSLLFIDARCRARPGLLAAHRSLLSTPGAALSTTETNTVSGTTFAARVAHLQQPFSLEGKIGAPDRLDFYPTANLGVLRSAYLATGGFREMRSGADADLCWRIQLDGQGTFAVCHDVLMDWVPRSGWRDLTSQWSRYGESTALLETVFPGESPAGAANDKGLSGRVSVLASRFKAVPPRDWTVVAGSVAVHLAFMRGYRRAKGSPQSSPPRTFEEAPVKTVRINRESMQVEGSTHS